MEQWRQELYHSEFYQNEIMHHGILGQKWGVRRYQNKDGSLTAAGRKKLDKLSVKNKNSKLYKKLNEADEKEKERNERKKRYEEYILKEKKRKEEFINKYEKQYDSLSKEDKKTVDNIINNFKDLYDEDYYYSEVEHKGMNLDISSEKGLEKASAVATNEFLKKFNYNKSLEGALKEWYDKDGHWIDKNNYSREDFKKDLKSKPLYISIDPLHKTAEEWYDGRKEYGYHSLVTELDMDTLKARHRSMQG